jgi:hypothetical protein
MSEFRHAIQAIGTRSKVTVFNRFDFQTCPRDASHWQEVLVQARLSFFWLKRHRVILRHVVRTILHTRYC